MVVDGFVDVVVGGEVVETDSVVEVVESGRAEGVALMVRRGNDSAK